MSQEKMSIVMKDGTSIYFDIRAIQDIDFYTHVPISVDDIVGEWISPYPGTNDLDCYEFIPDGAMKYRSFNYNSQLSYENDGTYSISSDNILTMFLLGTSLTDKIISCTGEELILSSSTYYKVQKSYSLSTESEPISIENEGDVIKYVDGCFVDLEDNKIKPIKAGCGYAIVEDAVTKTLKAYKIIVNS